MAIVVITNGYCRVTGYLTFSTALCSIHQFSCTATIYITAHGTVQNVNGRTAGVGGQVTATENVIQIAGSTSVIPVDRDSNRTVYVAAGVVTAKQVAYAAACHGEIDISINIGLIGTAVNVVNHITLFHTAYAYGAGVTGSHIATSV